MFLDTVDINIQQVVHFAQHILHRYLTDERKKSCMFSLFRNMDVMSLVEDLVIKLSC